MPDFPGHTIATEAGFVLHDSKDNTLECAHYHLYGTILVVKLDETTPIGQLATFIPFIPDITLVTERFPLTHVYLQYQRNRLHVLKERIRSTFPNFIPTPQEE